MKRIQRLICIALTLIITLSLGTVFTLGADAKWVGSWSTSPLKFGIDLGGSFYTDILTARTTIRTTLSPTLSGNTIRLKFSNLYGTKPLSITEVTVAKTGASDDEIDTSTVKSVTFNGGSKYANIPAGKELFSDPIEFSVSALEKISVSSYFEKSTNVTTAGLSGGVTYISLGTGNRTAKKNLTSLATKLDINASTITYHTIPFLINLDVQRTDDAYSVVIIGDSTVTNEAYLFLATKLYKNGIKNVGVLNQGIIGNRVLYDGASAIGNLYGESLISRFDKDALNQAGCKYIILKEGVNDILHPMTKSMKDSAPYVSPEQIIEGYKTLAKKAKDHGKKIYITTRTPYKGYTRDFFMSASADLEWSQEGQNMLDALNNWIVKSSEAYYDGYIQLSKLADEKDSTKLRDHFTLDGAHLSTYGQIAFADLIPAKACGIEKSLTPLSAILNLDPYTVTTSKPNNNNNASEPGFFEKLLSGFNGLMNNPNGGSSNITDTIGSAINSIGSVISGNQGGNSNSSNKPNTNIPPVTVPNITVDTNNPLTDTSADSNNSQAVVADIQTPGDTQAPTASNNSIMSTRQIVGILLLSLSGVILIAIVLIFLSSKSRPYGRDSLSRSARHLKF